MQSTSSLRISIIVPAYNAAETIFSCISSVLRVPTTEIELIVVDDGSIDDTLSIIRQFESDTRLKIVVQESNLGVSNARNIGILNASGKWITFLDSDDNLPEAAIFSMLQEIECADSETHLVVGSYIKNLNGSPVISHHGIDRDITKNTAEIVEYVKSYATAPYIYTLLVHCWGKLYQSVILKNCAPFKTIMRQLEDVELNFRYILSCDKVRFTKKIFYSHNIKFCGHNLSATSGRERNAVENIEAAYRSVDLFLVSKAPCPETDRKYILSNLYINTLVIWINRISRKAHFGNLYSSYQSIRNLLQSEIASRRNFKLYKYRHEHSILMLMCLWTKSALFSMTTSCLIYHAKVLEMRFTNFALTRKRAKP
jgi:glycosyltransferase involved in cell wall biosynthesis